MIEENEPFKVGAAQLMRGYYEQAIYFYFSANYKFDGRTVD